MEIQPILVRQATAPKILGMSEPEFNKHVRPYVTLIKQNKCVFYKYVDLQVWADKFVDANGRPGIQSEDLCQNEPQASEKKGKYGTLKKSSQVSSFEQAQARLNSKTRRGT